MAINPKEYTDYITALDNLMARGRVLGLYRTSHLVHRALQEARSEVFEAMPRNMITAVIKLGPVTKK